MAWNLRMRHKPGPLGVVDGPANGSGEQPSGLPQVELYIGGWVDVTALQLVRYQQGIRITRGQPDENQHTNPMTASFRLDNRDGRFSPRNPLSPYYGLIEKNTPCRISVQSGNSRSYRFWGEVSSWPQGWDPSGNDAWVDVQASGLLRRLGTGTAPLRSAPYMYWANPIPGRQAVAYWPMEDASSATQFASAVTGVQPMSITGAPSLAGYSGIAASDAIASFTTGSGAFGHIPTYTPGNGQFATSGFTCYVAIPSGGESSQTLISIASTGSFTYELYYSSASGGGIGVRGRDANGTVILDDGVAALSVNGVPLIAGVDISADPATNGVILDLTLQPVAAGSAQVFTQIESSPYTVGRFVTCKVNPTGALTGTAIGHIAVNSISSTLPMADYQGQPGEQAALRFQRLCNLLNIQSHIVFNAATFEIGPAMGPQHSGAFLDLLQECVDVDGGIMFELTDRLGLGYRMRDTLENQTSVLTLDYSQAQLSDVPVPVDDDTYTRNDVTATRLNGSSTRAAQSTGALNTGTPPAGVGTYATSITVNVQNDSQTADQAGWRLHLGTVAEPRYPTIGVKLERSAITTSPTLRPAILGVTAGDRVTVVNPPAWLPPDPISAVTLGWQETFDQFQHHVQFVSRPESPFRVAVTDDSTFGHADTDGSTLAAPLGAPGTANPFFTGGSLAGWAGFQGSIVATQAIAGGPFAWSCLFTSNGTAGGDINGFLAQFPIAAGGVAQTSCWVYFPTGGQVDVGVDWQDASNTYISTSTTTVTVPAATWTAVGSGSLSAPANTASAYPRVGPHTASNGLQLYVQGLLSWVGAVQVATSTSSSPVWTTAAADFPFDVTMGGERVTVTGVSGSSSPQTFTLARAANGVLKAQAVNTAVSLYQPATVAI